MRFAFPTRNPNMIVEVFLTDAKEHTLWGSDDSEIAYGATLDSIVSATCPLYGTLADLQRGTGRARFDLRIITSDVTQTAPLVVSDVSYQLACHLASKCGTRSRTPDKSEPLFVVSATVDDERLIGEVTDDQEMSDCRENEKVCSLALKWRTADEIKADAFIVSSADAAHLAHLHGLADRMQSVSDWKVPLGQIQPKHRKLVAVSPNEFQQLCTELGLISVAASHEPAPHALRDEIFSEQARHHKTGQVGPKRLANPQSPRDDSTATYVKTPRSDRSRDKIPFDKLQDMVPPHRPPRNVSPSARLALYVFGAGALFGVMFFAVRFSESAKPQTDTPKVENFDPSQSWQNASADAETANGNTPPLHADAPTMPVNATNRANLDSVRHSTDAEPATAPQSSAPPGQQVAEFHIKDGFTYEVSAQGHFRTFIEVGQFPPPAKMFRIEEIDGKRIRVLTGETVQNNQIFLPPHAVTTVSKSHEYCESSIDLENDVIVEQRLWHSFLVLTNQRYNAEGEIEKYGLPPPKNHCVLIPYLDDNQEGRLFRIVTNTFYQWELKPLSADIP